MNHCLMSRARLLHSFLSNDLALKPMEGLAPPLHPNNTSLLRATLQGTLGAEQQTRTQLLTSRNVTWPGTRE